MTVESLVFTLPASIDQTCSFYPVIRSQLPQIIFDFSSVVRISSYGIRSWLIMRKKILTKSVRFRNCTTAVVHTMNMVPDFACNAVIESFDLPFFCNKCQLETDFRIEMAQAQKPDFFAQLDELATCDTCKAYMYFGEIRKEYFLFLTSEK